VRRLFQRWRLGSRAGEHERYAARFLSHLRHDAGTGRANVSLMMGGRRVPYFDQADVDALPSMSLLDEESDERKISIAVACAFASPGSYTLESGVVRRLLRRRLPWPAEDVELLFRHAFDSGSHWFAIDQLAWATKAAEDYVAFGGDAEVIRPLVLRASKQVETCEGGFASERATLLKRLRTLARMSARAPGALELSLIGNDAWGNHIVRSSPDIGRRTGTSARSSSTWARRRRVRGPHARGNGGATSSSQPRPTASG
jgi:hypothetical protein